MKRSPFHKPKPVLIFNGAYVLVGITRSIRSASEISGGNPQAISFACTGRNSPETLSTKAKKQLVRA